MSISWKEFSDNIAITPTVVMSTAKWCGPCKRIKPLVHELKEKHSSIQFIIVDVDESSEVSEKLKIGSIPDFRFYRNGVVIDSFTGADSEKLKAGVDKLRGKV